MQTAPITESPEQDQMHDPAQPALGAPEQLLERLCGRTHFPSLGLTVGRIVSLAQDADESLQELGNLILGDVYLTQRVLSLANAALFRRNAGGTVTTVSRAIVILGFEQVRLLALGMLLLERIENRQQAKVLRAEFLKSFHASVAGREIAMLRAPHLREEIGIASLLRNVGRLMVGVVDYDSYVGVRRLAASGAMDEDAAAAQVLGMSYTRITGEILAAWGIPDTIVAATGGAGRDAVDVGIARREDDEGESMRRIVDCAQALGEALTRPSGDLRERALTAAFQVHGRRLGLGRARFDEIAGGTLERSASLRRLVGGEVAADEDEAWAASAPEALGAMDAPAAPDAAGRVPAGKDVAGRAVASGGAGTGHGSVPADDGSSEEDRAAVRQRALAGIEEVTEVLAQGQGLAVVLRTALEAMHTGFGYRRSVLLLREPLSESMRARLWVGSFDARRASLFSFEVGASGDLFAAAAQRGVDVQIRDTGDERVRARLPDWYRNVFLDEAGSFVLLPMQHQGRTVGCLYADRAEVEARPLGEDTLALLKTLRNQIVLALRTVRA